jgi:hypothetical protein
VQARIDSATRQPVADGGWVTNAGESFTIAATAGRPLLVLTRTYAPRASAITPSLNGTAMPSLPIAANPERFQTILLGSADGRGVRERNVVTVAVDWPDAREYSSFHYWAMQPAVPAKR